MAYRDVTLTNALVRDLWLDASATKYTLPARAGCSYATLARRAADLGLGPRHRGRLRIDRRMVRLMWLAGMSSYAISAAVGTNQSNIIRAVQAMGLPPRGPGFKARLTLVQFREGRLAFDLAGAARATAAVMRADEKSDRHFLRRERCKVAA